MSFLCASFWKQNTPTVSFTGSWEGGGGFEQNVEGFNPKHRSGFANGIVKIHQLYKKPCNYLKHAEEQVYGKSRFASHHRQKSQQKTFEWQNQIFV